MARGNNQKSLPGQGEGFNLCITQCVTNITYISNAHFSLHYRLRGSMGFEKYKKWTKVDTCFSINKPTKQDILHFLT